MSVGRDIEHHLRYPVAVLCAYETFAIMTKKVPTISNICVRQKILIPILLGGLAVHLLVPHKVEGTTILVDNA
jgi:hypothetical protein